MKYKPYPKYKDSGVEWLGEIPEAWEVAPLKRYYELQDRPVTETDDIVTAFRDGTVTLRLNRREDGFTNALQEIGYQGVRKGDLVIHAMDAFAGAIGVSDSDGKSTPVYSVCRARDKKVAFAYYHGYLLRSMAVSGYIAALAKGIRERSTDFRWGEAGKTWVPLPPLPTQRAIAAFLDAETARIDGLIKDYEDLIELLKEKRQALISHAVTRGLSELVSPDDPEFGKWAKPVKFKDSGVEWIGEIPEGWDASKIGYLTSFASGATPSKDNDSFWNGSIPWVSPKDMKVKEIWDSEDHVSELAVTESGLKLVPAGTLLIVVRGMILIRDFPVAITMTPVTINQDMKAVQVRDPIDACYLHLYLVGIKDQILSFFIDEAAHGTLAIRMDVFKALPVLLPPKAEQKAIATFLDRETSKLDTLVSESQSAIELLKEHRSALITNAVTGKISVEALG